MWEMLAITGWLVVSGLLVYAVAQRRDLAYQERMNAVLWDQIRRYEDVLNNPLAKAYSHIDLEPDVTPQEVDHFRAFWEKEMTSHATQDGTRPRED